MTSSIRACHAGPLRPSCRFASALILPALLAAGYFARAEAHDHVFNSYGPQVQGGTVEIAQERVTTLDPKETSDVYSCTVALQIHRGLLIHNANLTPVPCLARTWTISHDGRQYTFELNHHALFHNGREVTAKDVVYTIERIFRPDGNPGLAGQYLSAIEGADDYHAGKARRIVGISAPSRYVVEMRLTHPETAFLKALTLVQAAVVPREEIERVGDEEFGRHPVGCGPFKLVSNEENRICLAAFDGFFGDRALIDTLIFVTPPNFSAGAGVDSFLVGRYDLVEVPGHRRDEVARAAGVRLVSRRELSLSFVGMNATLPPFDDPAIRRALALATDRNGVLAANPVGQVLPSGILPPGMACYSPENRVAAFDIDAARAALAQAGHPLGQGLPTIEFATSRSNGKSRARADSVLVAGWQQAGFPIRVVRREWNELSEGITNYTLPLFSLSWVADIPDPDSFMGSLFASDSPNNLFRYRNPAVDSLLTVARTVVDPRHRQQLYGRIESQVLEDAPMIPLYTLTSAYGVRRHVHGLELTPLGISSVDFAHVWLSEEPNGAERVP